MSERLRELRLDRQAEAPDPSRWTQKGLAERLSTSPGVVAAWEAGRRTPRPFYRRRLAKAFGITLAELEQG